MKVQASLLCLAIASALAVTAAPADAAALQKSAVIARANALVGNHAALVRKAGADAFVVRDVIVDADGAEHVRYDRTFNGLPVIGGDVVVHSRNGQLTGVSQTLSTAARPALAGKVSRDQAIVEAGAHFGTRFLGAPTARTVVYALGTAPVLAHEVVFNGIKADQTPTEMHYIVDANSGRILNQWDGIHTAKPGPGGSSTCTTPAVGTGKTLTLSDVVINTAQCGSSSYQMVDLTRGGGATHNMAMKTSGMGTVFTSSTNVWGNNLLSDSQTVAADAHYGVATTWDYYKNTFGRMGIANDGKGAVSRVHYGRNYANAFWSDSCFCMTFGDGDNGASILPLVALDVAGHEMSHGVMSRTANLTYSGESGGLNESNSDIFGTMVEFYANNANDPGDYLIGEEFDLKNHVGFRRMDNPASDGSSLNCWSATAGNVDVHYSSGIGNHFFYLLSEGSGAKTLNGVSYNSPTCNGLTVTGIGHDAAAAIWYRALTVYMTSSTNYSGARTATLNAARDLYGAGSTQYNAVAAAWSAVSVN